MNKLGFYIACVGFLALVGGFIMGVLKEVDTPPLDQQIPVIERLSIVSDLHLDDPVLKKISAQSISKEPTGTTPVDPLTLASSDVRELFDLTNISRRESGMSPFSYDSTLQRAAELKVHDMVSKGYFSHTTPEGFDSWHWFTLAGYGFTYAGENLAEGFSSMAEAQDAFMRSPTHRANIIDRHLNKIGIATERGVCSDASQCGPDTGKTVTFIAVMFAD